MFHIAGLLNIPCPVLDTSGVWCVRPCSALLPCPCVPYRAKIGKHEKSVLQLQIKSQVFHGQHNWKLVPCKLRGLYEISSVQPFAVLLIRTGEAQDKGQHGIIGGIISDGSRTATTLEESFPQRYSFRICRVHGVASG